MIGVLFLIFLTIRFEAIDKRNSYIKIFAPLLFLFLIFSTYIIVIKKYKVTRIFRTDTSDLENENHSLSLFLSQNIKQFICISLYLFVLVLICINQIYRADKVLSNKDYSRVISFHYSERMIRSQEFPVLIETTSDYLFTYCKDAGFVSVYNKKSIEDLDFFVREERNKGLIKTLDSLFISTDSVKQKRVFILY